MREIYINFVSHYPISTLMRYSTQRRITVQVSRKKTKGPKQKLRRLYMAKTKISRCIAGR